jgi:hypothetical protein
MVFGAILLVAGAVVNAIGIRNPRPEDIPPPETVAAAGSSAAPVTQEAPRPQPSADT